MEDKLFIQALKGRPTGAVPFWFMRQAGRYLPEYRAVREEAGGFLNLAFTPELAAEVTVQPLRRFHMSAAILFSDILVVPYALGQDLKFETGEGPVLGPLPEKFDVENFHARLSPVYQAITAVREKMEIEGFAKETALIGFAGAPWTVACYMLEGKSEAGFPFAQTFMRRQPAELEKLINTLIDATAEYLIVQGNQGAEALQLFESWAGLLSSDPPAFYHWVIRPAALIAKKVRAAHPDIPLIGFPRGADALYGDYAAKAGMSAIGLDQGVTLDEARNLQQKTVVQGNLDPHILLSGGQALRDGALRILDALAGRPFIFNLGHGVIKETPADNVALLCETIRGYK